MIVQEEPRVVLHKVNPKSKEPNKETPIWRGIDKKLLKYILSNRYYPVKILEQNPILEKVLGMKKIKLLEQKINVVSA